jgi:hypothetical protein
MRIDTRAILITLVGQCFSIALNYHKILHSLGSSCQLDLANRPLLENPRAGSFHISRKSSHTHRSLRKLRRMCIGKVNYRSTHILTSATNDQQATTCTIVLDCYLTYN